jgi:hypothetical protein
LRKEPIVSKRTELAAQFIGHVRAKRYDEAGAMLADNVAMTVPDVGPIEGRDGVKMALRIASESGRGLERVSWPPPEKQPDGTVRLAGVAPGGVLGAILKVVRLQKNVTLTLGFADDDRISALDIVMA